MSDQYWSYIALAYGVTFVTIGVIAARIILEHRRLRAELARLEASGVKVEGEAA
jgi:heme exporter protein CcmD